MLNLKTFLKYFDWLVLLFCIVSLCFAYYIQFYLLVAPCSLCYIERWFLYFYIVFFALKQIFVFNVKQSIVFYIINFFSGCCVCVYHVLIERGFIVDSCSFDLKMLTSTVSCSVIGYEFFGFSLSSIIFVFYLCILFVFITQYYLVFIKKSDLEAF